VLGLRRPCGERVDQAPKVLRERRRHDVRPRLTQLRANQVQRLLRSRTRIFFISGGGRRSGLLAVSATRET
jgi:hypothetical protein